MNDGPRCILISLNNDINEIEDLARSLDYRIDNIFIQHRDSPDPKYYIGKGKVKEIEEYIKENQTEIAIINATLKPSQHYNLENALTITVHDRIRVILNIFADRAHSEEARLQVELAKLHYEIPLLRDWIHKARYGEKPGFMAGGEYEVAQYYEITRKRIKKIEDKLIKIEKEREIKRKQRKRLGYHLISIVGYTNAGKSTLFNMISGESVKVEDRLFTTLSTTTRKIPDSKKQILLTDTVGLIDNLPHWIIRAFHSTLEEMFLSDLILLVVDAHESISEINRKLRTSFNILLPDIEPLKIIIFLNKIDKIKEENGIQNVLNTIIIDYKVRDTIPISALNENHRDEIVTKIQNMFDYQNEITFNLPNISESQSFISWLHENCGIIELKYENNILIRVGCKEKDHKKILETVTQLKGRILKDNAL